MISFQVVHATPGASTRIAVSVEVFVTYCNRKAYLYKLYIILFKKNYKNHFDNMRHPWIEQPIK